MWRSNRFCNYLCLILLASVNSLFKFIKVYDVTLTFHCRDITLTVILLSLGRGALNDVFVLHISVHFNLKRACIYYRQIEISKSKSITFGLTLEKWKMRRTYLESIPKQFTYHRKIFWRKFARILLFRNYFCYSSNECFAGSI